MNGTHTPVEVMTKMERWISEHRRDPLRSQLRRMCPMVGRFHTPLALVEALSEYDEFFVLRWASSRPSLRTGTPEHPP